MPFGECKIKLFDALHARKELQRTYQYLQQGIVAKAGGAGQIGPSSVATVAQLFATQMVMAAKVIRK